MKIVVSGMGYVGFSLLTLLGKDNDVTVIDTNADKIRLLNKGRSPLSMEPFPLGKNVHPTSDPMGYSNQELAFVAVPTDFDPKTGHLSTAIVDEVVEEIVSHSPDALIVIKSTVPVGYTLGARKRFKHNKIIFSPEFLRESSYLEDIKSPSRIVLGAEESEKEDAEKLEEFFLKYVPSSTKVLHVNSGEAESIKIMSNAYLSLRVAFFNEVDNLAIERGYSSKNIIKGISMDPRIGNYYNEPSFGFGGYCLPKDEKEAAASFKDKSNDHVLSSIESSNEARKDLIARNIIQGNEGKMIGFYLLGKVNKNGKIRPTVTYDIFLRVFTEHKEIIIYEPSIKEKTFMGVEVVSSFEEFKNRSSVIVADRLSKEILDSKKKFFTRNSALKKDNN